jgi:hypothetical protein
MVHDFGYPYPNTHTFSILDILWSSPSKTLNLYLFLPYLRPILKVKIYYSPYSVCQKKMVSSHKDNSYEPEFQRVNRRVSDGYLNPWRMVLNDQTISSKIRDPWPRFFLHNEGTSHRSQFFHENYQFFEFFKTLNSEVVWVKIKITQTLDYSLKLLRPFSNTMDFFTLYSFYPDCVGISYIYPMVSIGYHFFKCI